MNGHQKYEEKIKSSLKWAQWTQTNFEVQNFQKSYPVAAKRPKSLCI